MENGEIIPGPIGILSLDLECERLAHSHCLLRNGSIAVHEAQLRPLLLARFDQRGSDVRMQTLSYPSNSV